MALSWALRPCWWRRSISPCPPCRWCPVFSFLLIVSLIFDIVQYRLAQEGKTEFLGFDWRAGIFVAAALLQIAIVWLWGMP